MTDSIEKIIADIREKVSATPQSYWSGTDLIAWANRLQALLRDNVVVPRKPTPEMLSEAGVMEGYDIDAGYRSDECHIAWWKAMLAAAPLTR